MLIYLSRIVINLFDSGYSSKTIRELVQELSDRLRQAIEKYERAKNVQVILYYQGCGAEDVTNDFIESMFPYPVKE
jgi:hypothetical protein